MAGVNDYFSFSKRERTGAIVLIILIGVVFLLPEFLPTHGKPMNAATVAEIRNQIAALKMIDTDSTSFRGTNVNEDYLAQNESSREEHQEELIFYFDPNTLSEREWKKLGISKRTVSTIQKYLSKGGQFRKPEDIGKIYGLRKDQYERLLPFVRIKNHDEEKKQSDIVYTKPPVYQKTNNTTPAIINVNEADTSMLIALPGIGSKLANRIINFRDKLGGFYSIDQFKDIYGLPDSTFQKIKPLLQCEGSGIQQININTADASTLKIHPYIKWTIANAIVNYRQQHGDYKSVEDLLKIDIISPEILQKISPYLRVN